MTSTTTPSTEVKLSGKQEEVILVMGDGGSLNLELSFLSLTRGTRGEPGYVRKTIYAATEWALRRKGLIDFIQYEPMKFKFILTDEGLAVYRHLKANTEGS